MPKVTIVIPNCNHARFLDRRFQSVLDQTEQDFEIIYIDDGSADGSDLVFSKYRGDKRVHGIFNPTPSGIPCRQWNRGIRAGSGEYIWIAESDDWADPRLLETLVTRLDSLPNAGIAYCQSRIADENDHTVSSCLDITDDLDSARWSRDFTNNGRDECGRYLFVRNTIPNASAVVFRRSIYKRAGGADETMRLGGDWLTWIKMLMISDITFVKEPLNYFRKHAGSVRYQAMKDGTYLVESERVRNYLKKRLPIPRQSLWQARKERLLHGLAAWLRMPLELFRP